MICHLDGQWLSPTQRAFSGEMSKVQQHENVSICAQCMVRGTVNVATFGPPFNDGGQHSSHGMDLRVCEQKRRVETRQGIRHGNVEFRHWILILAGHWTRTGKHDNPRKKRRILALNLPLTPLRLDSIGNHTTSFVANPLPNDWNTPADSRETLLIIVNLMVGGKSEAQLTK
jgi:hypothetical protein